MELFDAGLGDGAQPATLLKSPWDTGQSNASIIAIAIAGTGNSNVKLMLGAIGTLFIAAENIQLQAGYQARGYCSLRMFNDTAAAHDYGTGVTYGGSPP